MRDVNAAWVRGKENLDSFINSLLRSGYSVLVQLDEDSESMTGTPSYLVTYVDTVRSDLRFVVVDENDKIIQED